MIYELGDIIIVEFPFTNQLVRKRRPAAVVSKLSYNRIRPDVVTILLTSQLPSRLQQGDYLIEFWQEAGLLKPTAIKPIFATFEKRVILNKLGRLVESDRRSLGRAVQDVLAWQKP